MRKIATLGLFSLLSIIFNVTHASLAGLQIGVDPGHGGTDPGATCNDLRESDIALTTALTVKEFLEADGATVVMSRTTDQSIGITARANLFNSKGVEYMVSVHYNSAGCGSSANGVLAYIYKNSCSTDGGELAHSIVPQIINHNGLSTMQGAAEGELCSEKPGIFNTDYYGMVRQTSMPSTITETSFISNSEENNKLRDSDYLRANGWAIYAGIADFLGEKPQPLNSDDDNTDNDTGDDDSNDSDDAEKCVIIKVCPVMGKPKVDFHVQ